MKRNFGSRANKTYLQKFKRLEEIINCCVKERDAELDQLGEEGIKSVVKIAPKAVEESEKEDKRNES